MSKFLLDDDAKAIAIPWIFSPKTAELKMSIEAVTY